MTKQRIQIGIENSGTGDTLRAAMIKINNNFDELYDLQGQDSTGKAIDISGNTISSTFTNTDITISPNGTGNVVIDGDLVTNIIKSDDSTGVVIDDNLILTGTIKADSSSLIRISENVDIDGTVTATSFTGDGSGITGVTSTAAPLNVLGDDSTDMEIILGTDRLYFQGGTNITTSTDSGAQLTISVDDAPTFSGNVTLGGDIVTSGNDDITLEPGGTGDILLKAGGQVGIGSVSSPDTSLHVKTAAAKVTLQRTADANTPGLSFQNSGGNVRAELQMDGTSGTSNEIFVKTHDGSSLSERFRVKHTGAQVTGDLQVTGNFTVSGTTTSVNTTNLEIQDALLELSKNNSGGADVDAGLLIQRGSAGNNAAFYWNEGDDKFKAVLTTSAADASAVTDSSTATIVATFEGNITGDVTGNADTATALATARTIGGVSFDGSANINLPGVNSAGNQNTSGTAAVATTVTVTDNESTNEENVVTFVAGADSDGGNVGLESDGNFTYNPSTGTVTATKFKGDGSELTGISGGGGSSTLNVIGDDSTDMEIALGTDRLFFQGGTNITTSTDSGAQLTISVDDAPTFSGAVTAAGFTIGSAAINESELETIDGVTAGTVAASKAVVVDSNKDIGSFRNVTATGSFIIGSADMNETDLEKLDGITNGTVAANKAVVVDGNKDAASFRNITATGTITTATLDVNSIESTDSSNVRVNEGLDVVGGLFVSEINGIDSSAIEVNEVTNFNANVVVKADVTATGSFIIGSASMNETDLEKLDGITNGTAAANKAVVLDGSKDIGTLGAVTATSFVIGSADINETDLEKIDGITNGTVAANKAVVVDGSKDAGSFRNITATGTITTAVLDVNSIESTDSTAVRINEGLDVVGTLQTHTIEPLDSSQVQINDIRTQTITANDSTAVRIEDGLDVRGALNVNSLEIGNGPIIVAVLDEDNFASDSATALATQQSIKAYVGSQTGSSITFRIAGSSDSTQASIDLSSNEEFRLIGGNGLTTLISNAADNTMTVSLDDNIAVDEISAKDSSNIQIKSPIAADSTISSGAITSSGIVTATGFTIGSAAINETELETIDGVTAGTVAASKAVVVDSNKDIGSFRNITATGATTSGTFVIGSADINEADLEQIDGLTAGTVSASKAVVVDSDKDITGFRNVTASGNGEFGGNLQVGGNLTVSGTTTSVNTTNLEIQDALLELNKNNSGGADVDAGIFVQRGSAGNNAVLYWNEGDDSFKAVLSNSAADATSVTDSSFAALEVGSLTVNAGVAITASSGDVTVANATSNKDLIFTVNDGGSATEVFRLDGDVSALLVASGKELQFADSGEKISGDGTDLTIASGAKINLTATSDIHIPNDVGIVFGGDSEKIEGDGTDLVISANNLTVDAAADIILDAGGNDFNFKAGGTEILRITNSSSDVIIRPVVDAKDLIFQQRDGTEVARVEDNGTFNVVTGKLAINGTAITSTAAEINQLDDVTAGTVAASKVVVVDSNKDIGDFRNVTASGTVKTALLDVNSIFSTDSSNIRINEGLDVVGGLFVSEINAIDSSAIEVNEVTNFNANVVVKADVEATGSFIIGDASMNEADLEQLDGLTAGTVTASKAVVVDSDKDITGFRNVTATKFIIGSADIDETDLEKIDGITNGAGAANKALVLDGSADVASGLRNLTASGTVKAATLDINSIISTDSSNIRVDEGLDVVGGLFVSEINAIDSSAIEVNEVTNFNANVVVKADVTATGSFIIGSASMNETDLEKLDGITDGTVAANKAVVVDSNKDAGDFRNLTASTLTADGGVSIDNITIDGTEIDLSSGDLTLDVAGDIVLDAGGDEVIFKDGSTNVGHVSLDSDNLTIKSLVSDKDLILQGNDGGSGITALTLDMSEAGAATFNDTVTATGFIIGSADINEADLEQIDGLTAGTVAASKAVVVDSNKDAGDFRNVTLSGTLHTTTLDVREILSTDSTNITVNEGLEVLGTIQVNEITSSDSSEVTINNIRTQVITANDSTEVLINDALRVSGLITGTATAAQYSDLAERYEADASMEKGDVVEIGGDKEITKVDQEVSDTIFGVVSSVDQAGFTMNTEAGNDATHPLVALTGRVVVKVEGTVSKGDRLVTSATAGVARKALKSECNAFTVVGRALEDKSTDGIDLVLCYVQSHA